VGNIKVRSVKVGGAKDICQNKSCSRAGIPLPLDEFYKSRNPNIQHSLFCKDCIRKKIKPGDFESLYELLRILDIPFIQDVYDSVLSDRQSKDEFIDRYIREMETKEQYIGLTFEDSSYDSTVGTLREKSTKDSSSPKWSDEWQGEYTETELKYLNDYYEGLNNDFKIVTTNHKDYARKIAQASLSQARAYQKLLNGEDGADQLYEKATKIFDMLSKSAQFAESRRGASDVSLGCFGKVFDAVEKHNWIPKHVPDDDDMYDKLLKQFSNIERSL